MIALPVTFWCVENTEDLLSKLMVCLRNLCIILAQGPCCLLHVVLVFVRVVLQQALSNVPWESIVYQVSC